VECFDWLVPIRADLDSGLLDQTWSGRLRSTCIDSVSESIGALRSRSNGSDTLGFQPARELAADAQISLVMRQPRAGSETRELYLRAPGVEADLLARLQRKRKKGMAGIAHRRCSSGQWLRLVVALLESGCIWAGKHVREVRGEKLERLGPKRGLGVIEAHRNRRRSSSETAALRDLLRVAWWWCRAIVWGEILRRGRPSYSVQSEQETIARQCDWRRRNGELTRAVISARGGRRSRLVGGTHAPERGGEGGGNGSGGWLVGRGPLQWLGWFGPPPRPFSIFFDFSSLFFFVFIWNYFI
jgi:hypothetical protein